LTELRDRIQFLTRPEQVDVFVRENRACAIFKAGSCHKTDEVFRAVQEQLGPREDVPLAIIRVLEARPASNRVAEMTGIQHESPQLILFKDGKAVFDRDNWDIEAPAIAQALQADFSPVS
jgi:bacillithiol system protein YtxJ